MCLQRNQPEKEIHAWDEPVGMPAGKFQAQEANHGEKDAAQVRVDKNKRLHEPHL